MAELVVAELTKAEQKIKDQELTPAELATFGVLPPEPDKPMPVKSHQPVPLDKSGADSDGEGKP